MWTHGRVDESNAWFTLRDAGIIHHGQDSSYDGSRCRRSIDKLEYTVESDDIPRPIGRKIGICAGL